MFFLLLLFVALSTFPTSQEHHFNPPVAAGCPSDSFSGEVKAGEGFAREFGNGLTFRLTEEKDPAIRGWTIQIHEASDSEKRRDYLLIATPPYRSWNQRDLRTSHGYSAKEIIQFRVRKFYFVANRREFDHFQVAVENGLFSGHTEQEAEEAVQSLLKAPRCQGQLRVVDAKIEETEDGRGRILWLKFEVDLGEGKKKPESP